MIAPQDYFPPLRNAAGRERGGGGECDRADGDAIIVGLLVGALSGAVVAGLVVMLLMLTIGG
jgi:hypothetical protein